jgi:hypothetical protein
MNRGTFEMNIQLAGSGGNVQLGPNGSLVATPNQTMAYIGVGRAKLYELINSNELESYVEGSARKILWPSIHAYVKRRLAAEAARRGRAA